MSRPRAASATHLLLTLLGVLIVLSASSNQSVSAQTTRISCSASSPCPASSPCCSAEGVCGSGAMQCAGGCQPMMSFKASSCLPNPVCQSRQLTITPNDYNNTNIFMPILEYNGSATSPFTLDSGSIGPGPEGVLLQLKAAQQAKISTTDYIMYGYVEATLRHNARQGLVAAFISMSDIKDEIDWEFITANSSLATTNYFWMGVPVHDHAVDLTPSNFNVSDWHTYGLNWTSSRLQWTIDGSVVRTLTRSQAGSSYPRSPSRIQFSTWAGGNVTNPEGTIEWAGGPIDWNTPEYQKNGFYSQEIKQFNVQCASLDSLNLNTVSGNSTSGNVTSFVYTGGNSTTTGEPEFGLSTLPLRALSDPGADGYPGYPGYGMKLPGQNDAMSAATRSTALKFALPIAGALVGLGAAWAIVAFVRRRNMRAPVINAIGVTGVNDSRFSGPKGGYARPAANLHSSSYADSEKEPTSLYRNEPNMNMMMGGGIMSDAGVSHLQRQTTGSSTKSIADRILGNQGGKRYQQLGVTPEDEQMELATTTLGYSNGPSTYQSHAYVPTTQANAYGAQQNAYARDYDTDARGGYGGSQSYYSTPAGTPARQQAQVGGHFVNPYAGDTSYEQAQLSSPQRRALPIAPYTPNYAQAPQRPSGRMYDTPNMNYYPTPMQHATPFAGQAQHAAPYTPNSHQYGYPPNPQAPRQW